MRNPEATPSFKPPRERNGAGPPFLYVTVGRGRRLANGGEKRGGYVVTVYVGGRG